MANPPGVSYLENASKRRSMQLSKANSCVYNLCRAFGMMQGKGMILIEPGVYY